MILGQGNATTTSVRQSGTRPGNVTLTMRDTAKVRCDSPLYEHTHGSTAFELRGLNVKSLSPSPSSENRFNQTKPLTTQKSTQSRSIIFTQREALLSPNASKKLNYIEKIQNEMNRSNDK